MIGLPTVALVVSPETLAEKPFKESVAVLFGPKETGPLPSALLLPKIRFPALSVTPPLNVLLPPSVNEPAPDLMSDSAPPPAPSTSVPAKTLEAALFTVKLVSEAPPFRTEGVPGVALVAKPVTEIELPLRLRMPVLDAPNVTALALFPRARALPRFKAPALIVTPPVKVFAPLRVNNPAP